MKTVLRPYPRTKDSGLAWLGDVPEHWEMRRAKALFEKMARPPQAEDEVVTCFRDGMVTLRKNRRLTGFTESLKEIGYQGVRRGDLVIHQMDAFAGAVGVSDSDGKSTPVYAVCRPRGEANVPPHYYARVVGEMARSQWIAALAKGIRERSTDFHFETFAALILPLPPHDEQDAIVKYLTAQDAAFARLLRIKRRMIELLNEQKSAIIHRAVTRGLNPAAPLQPSGLAWLGDVPEHWEVIALKRVLSGLIDCEHKTAPNVDESGFRVVRTSAVKTGWGGLHSTQQYAGLSWSENRFDAGSRARI